MSETVWISLAPGHGSNIGRPFKSSFSDTNQEQGIKWGVQNSYGEPLPEPCFPKFFYGNQRATESAYRLPDLFRIGEFWITSRAAANVLEQFNMGDGALYPVEVFTGDKVTPVGSEWFCINFGNKKSALRLDQSISSLNEAYIRNGGVKGWTPKPTINDGDIYLTNAANNGSDIWMDTLVGDAFFMSSSLGRALRKAKADKGFFLKACLIV
jgi:hypothetical protein